MRADRLQVAYLGISGVLAEKLDCIFGGRIGSCVPADGGRTSSRFG